ncbi:MAG: excinuclease ABC subunit B [Candidatus Wallbacteria bacterium HGW-Wallbacteria-1]|jgi:excinuclease ABC subunit B|uniref:UvrABC system protein B n=1 Tax=Candidatus Wallbacteria bacterium HGW-Wallbacteria-1 TaxID=2013854 RepID=A0A2N1PQ36_9BACT|nr:MAG: excinuclease ABC subunit B [Candidatus Wallbacteria bacterium HGW-Wallbacteria-1]
MDLGQPRTGNPFRVKSNYEPVGDQVKAIRHISESIEKGVPWQTLLGVTGSGKTFAMAKVIETVQRPTLIVTHNKTLAAQLYTEFRDFFPTNMVGYFVSYYDYYQPEAYVAARDLYIEKDAQINEKIDNLRHVATYSLFDRRDVIIVASVSCIYGLGDPSEYVSMRFSIERNQRLERDQFITHLVEILYERNDMDPGKRKFRVRGDIVEVYPPYLDNTVKVEFFGDEVDSICLCEPITGRTLKKIDDITFYPANHYVASEARRKSAVAAIRSEMEKGVSGFREQGKLVESQRLRDRTLYDLEMISEMGSCKGIENYSRHMEGRVPGSPPLTLIDYFPRDFLLFVDESHVTIPQFRGMVRGDRSRKESLVNFGFRLDSAFDNRPLNFDEFTERLNQTIFVSATPETYEMEMSGRYVAELITRPTGLLDPEIFVRPASAGGDGGIGQVDDLVGELNSVIDNGGRVLVTVLTKRMAEELTDYLVELGIAAEYLHSDIDTVDRVDLLRRLREGDVDVIVGINLLREGLDLPEVTLVAILDADKEGFLRSARSLIQTCGRAARNASGRVIMYADRITPAMQRAISETARRREIQARFNAEMGIVPRTVVRALNDGLIIDEISSPGKSRRSRGSDRPGASRDSVSGTRRGADSSDKGRGRGRSGAGGSSGTGSKMTGEDILTLDMEMLTPSEKRFLLEEMNSQMRLAAENLDFERAAAIRDRIRNIFPSME